MPNKTDDIVAQFEKLLRAKRGARSGQVESRLLQDRPILSRDFDNQPVAGWEKAAALIGAALSPGSTIAGLVLGRPEDESLFDRQIKNPDGSYSYPQVSESVVPKLRKRARAEMRPNPIVHAIQQHFKMGAAKDPANDLINQKINDRNFLVHATRPKDSKLIRKAGGILPGQNAQYLPEEFLNDPVTKNMIANRFLELNRSPFSGKLRVDSPKVSFRIVKDSAVGVPGTDAAPGVSMSRQMTVPALNEEKSYRFLVDPKTRKTFSTAEPGYEKAGRETPYKKAGWDRHESEERTYGKPIPVTPFTRALTPDSAYTNPLEETVLPRNTEKYRATMGNERFKEILERVGFKQKSFAEKKNEYEILKKVADDLWNQMMKSSLASEYSATAEKWAAAHKAQTDAFDKLYK